MVQEEEDVDDLLTQYVDESPRQGEDASPENGLGATLVADLVGRRRRPRLLDRARPPARSPGQTLLVYGRRRSTDQETVLRELTLDPVSGGASATDCDTDDL